MIKYLWNVINSYLAVLALLHVILWLCFHPYCVTRIASLQLLPWAVTSVNNEKLLSIIEYATICAVTPVVALLAIHDFKSSIQRFVKIPIIYLMLLTVLSIGSLRLSHQVSDNLAFSIFLLLMTLACLGMNIYSSKLASRFHLLTGVK